MQFDQSNDASRVQSLCGLGVLDTPSEPRFDRLTRLASALFGTPIALISLVDEQRQWFKSKVGLEVDQTPRSVAFCSHAVALRELLVVPDASLDARFADNPLVTGAPHIRFYAGHPVYASDGEAVGTLCVIDTRARQFDQDQRARLADLALLVQDELNKNVLLAAKMDAERALHELNIQLERRIDERTRAMRETNEALKREIRQREAVEATLRRSEQRIGTIIESSFSAFVSVDAAGRIVDWNAAAERTFGWSHAEVAGSELAMLIFPERWRDAQRSGMQHYLSAGEDTLVNQRVEMPAVTRAGKQITVEMTISAYGSDEGVFFGFFLHDISERQQAELALQQKSELLNAVLETIDVGVVACSADGELTLFNRAAREFHGLSVDQVSPHEWAAHYDLFAADGRTRLEAQDVPLFRAMQGETVKDLPMSIAPKGMRQRLLLASGRPLAMHGGACGAVVAMKDITELNESQRRLRLNEHRLRAITENLPVLIGQVDSKGCFAFLNSQASRHYGKPLEQLLGKPVRSAYSAPEYERIALYVEAALAGKRVSFEDSIEVKGKRTYFSASYIPDMDASGAVHGFYAMAFDITFRKNSELAQRDSEERLRTITDNLPVLISYFDRDLRFQFANALYQDWMGVAAGDMIGRSARELFGDDFQRQREVHFSDCLAGQTVQFELPIAHGEGSRTVHTVLIPHLRDGAVVGVYALSTDVTATRIHEAQLKRLAHTDTLTGLPNRRSYEHALAASVERGGREGGSLALMYLDIDHFKQINDSLGHAAGDAVLKEFAQRLRKAVRKSDLVCRLAGDEFTILLEGVHSARECERIAAKVVAMMGEPFLCGSQPLAVSASIGVAWDAHCLRSAVQLGQVADGALYQAKDKGRNRYQLADAGL